MVITYSKSMDQPGKVANPTRCQLNRENTYRRTIERRAENSLKTRTKNTHAKEKKATVNRHQVCMYLMCLSDSAIINIVPMAFTAENPPAQGQYSSPQGRTYVEEVQPSTASKLVPTFIRSRNRVAMAFTAESPPAQGASIVLKVARI